MPGSPYTPATYSGGAYTPAGSLAPVSGVPGTWYTPDIYAGGAYSGGPYFPTMAAGPVTPTATSLLGAIKDYWIANGLDDPVLGAGPLYAEGTPGSTPTPFVVIDRIDEVLPGITPDDKPVEMWLTVWHKSAEKARAAARLIEDHFGDPSEVPNVIERDRLVWTVGSENFAERDSSSPSRTPKKYLESAFAYLYRMHFRFWIKGRP